MDKAGRRIRAAFEGLQSLLINSQRVDLQAMETLCPEDFALTEIACHGFPYQPTCMAYDPVQKLMAIGTQCGAVRILGQPGVNANLKHQNSSAILQLQFVINEGSLISLCSDCTLHMWNVKLKRPEIMHTLKFGREKLIIMHLPFQSRWLYLGTEKGNVHIASVETFTLSGYVINWNKAVDLSQKVHPGIVVHLSECPTDDSKLLIGYECGTLVLWDLKERLTDTRYQCHSRLRSVSWSCDGKQFLCSLINGSLMTWTVRRSQEPADVLFPLANLDNDAFPQGGKSGSNPVDTEQPGPSAGRPKQHFRPIDQVEWCSQKNGEELIVFSGGTPFVNGERPPCVTILRGRSISVLEMEHPIVSFITLCDSPYASEEQDCPAIAVLLQNDLVAIDLKAEGCPCFENPYSMDIHDSAVTCCAYLSDCPIDLIRALYATGSKQKRRGYTSKKWPLTGGVWGSSTSSDPELIITGHADGSLKFWDFSSVNLQILYRLRTAKLFEVADGRVRSDFNFFSITHIALCPASRCLVASGLAGQVLVFKFSKQEAVSEIAVIEVPVFGYPLTGSQSDLLQSDGSSSTNAPSGQTSINWETDSSGLGKATSFYPLKVKVGSVKRPGGYLADIVCMNSWPSVNLPEAVTKLAFNSAYGLLAYGTDQGLVVIDTVQKCTVLIMETSALYNAADPLIRSPKAATSQSERNACTETSEARASSVEKADPASGSNCRSTGSLEGGSTPARHQLRFKSQSTPTKPYKAPTRERALKDRESTESSSEFIIDEGVCILEFIENSSKIDVLNGPKLWVGTTYGSIMALSIEFPEPEQRHESAVTVNATGFLDCRCNLLLAPVKFFKDFGHEHIPTAKNRVLRRANTVVSCSEKDDATRAEFSAAPSSSALGQSLGNKDTNTSEQYIVVCAERACRLISLSTLSTLFQMKFDVPLVQACVITFNAKPLVVGCFTSGRLCAYSLPTVRTLLDVLYLPANLHCLETVQFGHQGAGVFMCSPTELTKFAISAHFAAESKDILGSLYLPCVTPPPPKQNFFKELFSINNRNLDREELFGTSSSAGSARSGAKTVPHRLPQQSQSLETANRKKIAAANEVQRAKMALIERGEKLGDVEERTAVLVESAKSYADHVQELMMKQKNKKWYQL